MKPGETWASDTPISRPEPIEMEPLVDFGGFAFTMGGIALNVTSAEIEDIFTPPFMPEGFGVEDDFDSPRRSGDGG